MEASLLSQRVKLGEPDTERHSEHRYDHHHAHQAQHDLEVRVHSVAEEQVWILIDPLVRLRDFEVHSPP